MALGSSFALILDPEIGDNFFLGGAFLTSSIANYNFELAEITKQKIEKKLYIELGKYLLKNNLERYWVKDKEYGGYYRWVPVLLG